MEKIKTLGDTTPPPQGTITRFMAGTEPEGVEDLVKISSPETVNLASGDMVNIQNSQSYNGLYQASKIDDDSFAITLAPDSKLGNWESIEEEAGLIFDGQVIGYEIMADGRLKVTASNHGLNDTDEVLLTGLLEYNNSYQIQKLDDANFAIQRQWPLSEAVNVKLESNKRRGIMLDGVDEYIEIPHNKLLDLTDDFTLEVWIKPSVVAGRLIDKSFGSTSEGFVFDIHKRQLRFINAGTAIYSHSLLTANVWQHVAVSFSQNEVRLYVNGQLKNTAQPTGPGTSTDLPVRIGCQGDKLASLFNGCISDVRVWEMVRSEKAIQDSMYLQLTGKEVALTGYWRLGGISEGKRREVVDFSINANTGIVYGDAYTGAIVLQRTLRDGMPAAKYSNDHLVAVSQRATYVESFEFKLDLPVDVNNADGNGNMIFKLTYWGKHSRGSDTKTTIAVQQDDFIALADGWFKAACRFTIPDDVAMLRTFELSDIRGNWVSMNIRKHRICMVSDAITQVAYNDSYDLTTLADNQTSLLATLNTLAQKEQSELDLLSERITLQNKLVWLKNIDTLIRLQEEKVNEVQFAHDNTEQKYQNELNKPFNYLCKISISGTGLHLLGWNGSAFKFIEGKASGSLWSFIDNGGGSYSIKQHGTSVFLNDNWALDGSRRSWYLRPVNMSTYILHGIALSFVGYLPDRDVLHWINILLGRSSQLYFEKTETRTTKNIENAATEREKTAKVLTVAQHKLQALKDTKKATPTQIEAWKERVKEIPKALGTLQHEISTANTLFVDAIAQQQQTPQAMLKLSQDSRQLETQGALLGFVRSASRLNALATCDGNVQLSYLDDLGRMRNTCFDAASDSLNTSFEQWLPDSLRTCLNFDNDSSALVIAKSIKLSNTTTIEGWFSYPFSKQLHWYVLASSEDNKQELVVYNGRRIGIRINGFFFDSGCDLSTLSPGWHHMASSGEAQKDSCSFYIDGVHVGDAQSRLALQLDDRHDFVRLPTLKLDFINGFSLEVWLRYANFNQHSRVIDFGDKDANQYLGLGNKDKVNTLVFVFGSKVIEVADVLQTGQWMHLTATFDGTDNLQLYINGLLVGEDKLIAPANFKLVNNYIGNNNDFTDRNYSGDVAQVRLWNRALNQTDIQDKMGMVLNENELGLVGNWAFNGNDNKAIDNSNNGYQGIIEGEPAKLTLIPRLTDNIHTLGNIVDSHTDQIKAMAVATNTPVNNGPPITDGLKVYLSGESLANHHWEDLSGHNNHVSQYGNYAMATPFDVTDYNGKKFKVARMSPATGMILPDSFSLDKPLTIILIDRYCGPARGRTLQSRTTNWLIGRHQGDSACYAGGWVAPYKRSIVNEFTLATLTMQSSTSHFYNDGNLQGSNGGFTAPGKLGFGYGGKVLQPSDADIACVLIYDRVLSDIERKKVELWAGNRYGISVPHSPTLLMGDNTSKTGLSFDGVDDSFNFGNSINLANQSFTIELWIKLDRTNINSFVIYQGANATNKALHIGFRSNNVFTLSFYGNDLDTPAIADTNWHHWACTYNVVDKKRTIYQDGMKVAEDISTAHFSGVGDFMVGGWSALHAQACIAELRIWHKVRSETEIRSTMSLPLAGFEPGLTGYWPFREGSAKDLTANSHQSITVGAPKIVPFDKVHGSDASIANPHTNEFGKLAEIRVWDIGLSADEIAANSKTLLSGNEPGLLAYYPMNEGVGTEVRDHSGNGHHGTMSGASWWGCAAPIGALGAGTVDAVSSCEYSTISYDPKTGRKSAMMRKFFASPTGDGVEFFSDKRIEQLHLKWIGNAQFAPTLLGYIEGAPPVPSENLTVQSDYNGATSVELNMSQDIEYSWNRTQDSGLGASFDLFAGVETESFLGIGSMTKAAEVKAGFKGNLDFSYQFMNESNITSTSSTHMTNRLEVRGTPEQSAKFPHLGKRFIPKNVGYALVISSLADVYISTLARSGKMVGYDIRPVEGIPPDVNTITFMINPAYTMNGSLDGMTGSSATSKRFYEHVPQMRNQYGSLYPASYYRLKEAYDLKQSIEREDKRRESYFQQFNVGLLDEASLNQETNRGTAPSNVSVNREEDKPNTNLTEAEQQAQAEKQRQTEQAAVTKGNEAAAISQKKSEINQHINNQEKRIHAMESFAGWQKKMENILIRSGKRNIVNSYVWDGDGGIRSEGQSFASTAQHTIGGSFSLDAGLGFEGEIGAFGAKVELTALATVNLTQTMNKTESRSQGIQLDIDLSGVGHIGITDHNDYPIQPGEKVDRYRFMSYYLEGSTDNHNDFFNYVVDPEWLRSNDEEARALRQAMGKANKTWRVLHRVTYVERPALMGFGRDLRKKGEDDDVGLAAIFQYFDQLNDKHQELKEQNQTLKTQHDALESKLDTIINLLNK